MYEIDAPAPRPRPFWQKPVAILYLGLIPAVVAVNYVSARVADLFDATERVTQLEKEVAQLKRQVAERSAPAYGADPLNTQPGVPAPPVTPVIVPSAANALLAVPPLPRMAPPVHVAHRSGKAASVVTAKAEQEADPEPKNHAEDIPEPGKFTLLADQQQVAGVKSTFKLIGDR